LFGKPGRPQKNANQLAVLPCDRRKTAIELRRLRHFLVKPERCHAAISLMMTERRPSFSMQVEIA
jgi:hypothetical protein